MGFFNSFAEGVGGALKGGKNWLFGGGSTKDLPQGPNYYDYASQQLSHQVDGAQGRAAPQAQTAQMGPAQQLASGPQNQAREGQMQTANRLGAVASGQQAGAGELAVNRQVSAQTAAQASAARMARGSNAALAYRNAARNTMDIGQAGAGQAAAAQMQDQQAANAQLGQMYGQMRGQDVDVASQNAQLGQQAMIQQAQMGQQTSLANLQAQLAQSGMNDQQQMAAMQQMLGWDQTKLQAQLQGAQLKSQDKGILAGLFSGGGQALAAISDERLKSDIADGREDADEFMGAMSSKTWRYKDEGKHGKGRRLGPMAQDLAKSKMGSELVVQVDDEGHIGFDVAKATSASLASIARLHERLSALEGSKAKPAESKSLGYLASKAG